MKKWRVKKILPGRETTLILRKMKLTVLLSLMLYLSGFGNTLSQSTKLSLDLQDVPVKEFIRHIEDQTEFYFIYQDDVFSENQKVTIRARKESLESVIQKMAKQTSVEYRIFDRQIVILKREKNAPQVSVIPVQVEIPVISQPERKIVTGTVTDEKGVALIGASIMVKGTTIGTITDMSGKFELTIPLNGQVLIFSYVGYVNQEIVVDNQTNINIQLLEDVKAFEELVVVGYGTIRRRDLTGSVTRVSMEDKSFFAHTILTDALSGVSAGMNVSASGGAGATPSLSIRGKTSLSASEYPLIVLDGVIYTGSIANININDVETIDILKDASAAAVFGSRSANGVIIITTKKGTTDKPTVSFNMYYGYQDMTNNPMKVMNSEQYAIKLVDYYYQQNLYNWYKTGPTSDQGKPARPNITDREVVAATLRSTEESNNYLAGNEVDWVDEVLKIAPIQNYNLSFSGKTERSNYFVSGSYTNEEGILLNDKFERFTLRTNLESEITDWFTLGLLSSFSYRDYSGLNASLSNARNASPLANNPKGLPYFNMYLTNEQYMPYPLNNLYADNTETDNDLFFVGSGKITVPWIKGLIYELSYSRTSGHSDDNTFYPRTIPQGALWSGRAIKNPATYNSWIVNNIFTYSRTFSNHRVNATLLYSLENMNSHSTTAQSDNFDNSILGFNNLSLGNIATVSSSAWEESSLSYMGRVNYIFKDRYLLTSTIRRDGYSGFGKDNKFATFPSIALGWTVSEESFFENIKGFYLKLRTSYGKNGNQGIGRYSSLSKMASEYGVFGSNTVIGIYPTTLGNESLAWEETLSFNMGIDYGFLSNRISGSVDVYNAETTNVLVRRAIPTTTGYSSVWTNLGGLANKGIDLELATINFKGNFNWKTNFVFSINRNKITKLYGGDEDRDIGNQWFVGEPISSLYAYEMAGGIWQEEDLYNKEIYQNWLPGQYKWVDQNGDNVIDPNNDRTIVGYSDPSYRFSINNNLSYKNFTLSFFINSVQGGKNWYLADNTRVINTPYLTDVVVRTNLSAVRPYWRPDNPVNNATAIFNAPSILAPIFQSRSYTRLQEISLMYNLDSGLLNRLQINGLQLYISSKNPVVWTKWSGWDPETGTSDNPLMRNIIAGVRITL